MKLSRCETKKPRVEMMALIDAVFLILVFFIYSFISMTVHRGVNVDLPVAGSSVVDKNDYNSITVDKNNNIFFNKTAIDIDNLNERLTELKSQNKDPLIYLNGDKQARHGTIVAILDKLKEQGIKKIAIEVTDE